MDWNKINHYIIAGVFAGFCGILTFGIVYYFAGLILSPIQNWLIEKLGE